MERVAFDASNLGLKMSQKVNYPTRRKLSDNLNASFWPQVLVASINKPLMSNPSEREKGEGRKTTRSRINIVICQATLFFLVPFLLPRLRAGPPRLRAGPRLDGHGQED